MAIFAPCQSEKYSTRRGIVRTPVLDLCVANDFALLASGSSWERDRLLTAAMLIRDFQRNLGPDSQRGLDMSSCALSHRDVSSAGFSLLSIYSTPTD
jgi:hypothetical protein